MREETYICDLCKSEYDPHCAEYKHTTSFAGGLENYGSVWQADIYKPKAKSLYDRVFSWKSFRSERINDKGNIDTVDTKLYHIEHVCNECAQDIENYILSKIK